MMFTEGFYWNLNNETREVEPPLLQQAQEDAQHAAGRHLLGGHCTT
jgi:hypothetical protein